MPREQLEKAKARYDALKREHRKDQAALATAGDALLEELGLAVAFHDAGSWTRVVARKNVPDPVSETHEPHEHMHEPHSPGTWLLRERLRKKHPEGEVGLVEDLVRASNRRTTSARRRSSWPFATARRRRTRPTSAPRT